MLLNVLSHKVNIYFKNVAKSITDGKVGITDGKVGITDGNFWVIFKIFIVDLLYSCIDYPR